MKTIKYISSRVLAIIALALVFTLPANAQLSDNGYASIDWKFNAPMGNHFANKASGWGMNFSGGYFFSDNIGLGLFLNYSSNHKYIGQELIPVDNGVLYTDQQHTVFQLPFGVSARYQFNRGGVVQPYISANIGAEFAKYSTDYNVFETRQKTWGFYVSPEIGINVFPWSYGPGLHLALYYSYGTNKVDKIFNYHEKGLNNIGFLLGVSF